MVRLQLDLSRLSIHASPSFPFLQLHENTVIFKMCVCDVGMPVVFVVVCIPPMLGYFLALPSLLPSAITVIENSSKLSLHLLHENKVHESIHFTHADTLTKF